MIPIRSSIISLILAIALFLGLVLLRLGTSEGIIEEARFLMGSTIQIKVSVQTANERAAAKKGIGRAFKEIARIEDMFSVFKEDSEISRINRTASLGPVEVGDEAFALIEKSIEFNKITAGAFDITIGPLVELWRRAKLAESTPSNQEVKDALSKKGSDALALDRINKSVSFKKRGMSLDLGGVAQGYATDRAIEVLKSAGVRNAIVNLSGDMYCLGRRSKKSMWNVGIQHPRDKNKIFLSLNLTDKAINTSGDYEKYFIINGKRYSHIIDPRTGYPVGDDIVSATVIAPDSATSDMLATALCVLRRDGLKVVESIEGVDAIIIMKVGSALRPVMTKGLKTRYNVIEKNGS